MKYARFKDAHAGRNLANADKKKVLAMEALWNSLSSKENEVEVPQWHKDLLDAREEKIRLGQAQFIPWEEAKRQIDAACP